MRSKRRLITPHEDFLGAFVCNVGPIAAVVPQRKPLCPQLYSAMPPGGEAVVDYHAATAITSDNHGLVLAPADDQFAAVNKVKHGRSTRHVGPQPAVWRDL